MTKENTDALTGAVKADGTRSFASLTLDIAYYQALLDEEDMDPGHKRELIETLWAIVVAFVDLGFGAHPVQQAQGADSDAGDNTGSGHNLQGAVREFIAVQRREDNQQEESEHA
jgi:hypothetical protein